MAAFAQFPFFHDARLGSLAFNPASFTESLTAFCRRPFPDWLAVAYFLALKSIGIRLRRNSFFSHAI
jgi:hypothetical protein